MRIRQNFAPTVLRARVKRLLGRGKRKTDEPEFEYIPEGWEAEKTNTRIKGWNDISVLEAYKAGWPLFLKNIEGAKPFFRPHEVPQPGRVNIYYHNAIMSYGYSLLLAARGKSAVSILDWGGGIGHYYLISRALAPDLTIDYHCKDIPLLAEYGREIFPQSHFYSGEECFKRKYDFVLAGSSLHYSQDWRTVLKKLANSAAGYLLVTQSPFVFNCASFVMVQRAYKYGYNTEYLGWCLNRGDFLDAAKEAGLKLIREFIIGSRTFIHRAPEQCEYRGFLFE